MINLRKKLIAICLMLFSTVMLIYGCDKNEYKNLTLEVSNSEIEIVLNEDSPENNLFPITAKVSGMPKGYNGAVSFSVPVNNGVIEAVKANPDVNGDGESIGIFEAKKQGGPVIITVTTLEGNLSKNITVTVVKPVSEIAFNTLNIPVVKGVKTDISKFYTIKPEGTLQDDVNLELVPLNGGESEIIKVETDGKYLTVPTDVNLTEFQLRVRSAIDSEIITSSLATVKVINVLPTDLITLIHDNNTPTIDEDDLALPKNAKGEYELVLATNTGNLFSKTLFFDFNADPNENNNYIVGVKGRTNSGSIIDEDGQENRFVEIDNHVRIRNGFEIKARGNGNTKITFVIDRADFPGYFTQTITLNVSVQAYPTKIEVNNSVNNTKLDVLKLFVNYDVETFGTPFRVVVSNETGPMLDQKVIANLTSGEENISLYDANKTLIEWGSEIFAGAKYYLKHNFTENPTESISLTLVSTTYNKIFLNLPITVETQPINLTTTSPEVFLDVTKPEVKTPLVINGLTGTINYSRDLEIVELSNCDIINYEASATQITVWPKSDIIGVCSLKVVANNGSSVSFIITLYEQLITGETSVSIAGEVIAAKEAVGGTYPEVNIKNGLNIPIYFTINGRNYTSLDETGLIYHSSSTNSQVVQSTEMSYSLQTKNMSGSAHIELQIIGFDEYGEQVKAVYFEILINVSVPLTTLTSDSPQEIIYDINSLSSSQISEYGIYTIELSSSPFNANFGINDLTWSCEYNGGQLRAQKTVREDRNTIDYTFRTSNYDVITLTTTKTNFKVAEVKCQIASSTTSVITFNIVAKVDQQFKNENGLIISDPKSAKVRFIVYKAEKVSDFVFENVASKGTKANPIYQLTYDERDLEFNGSIYTNEANCIKTVYFNVYPVTALNKDLGVLSSSGVVSATVNNVLKSITITLLSKPASTDVIKLTVYPLDDVNGTDIGKHKIIQIRVLDGRSERTAFEIKNEADLLKVNSSLSSYYVLASDVAISNEWVPIGKTLTSVQQFSGNFSGKYVVYDENDVVVTTSYYSISGLNINNNDYDYYGLFAYLGENSKVSDLSINNFSIRATISHDRNVFVGALAGYAEGEINNVSVNDQSGVQAFNGLHYETATVGETASGIYITAETNTNIHANYFVGGLVGFLNNSALHLATTAVADSAGHGVFEGLKTLYKVSGSDYDYYNKQVVNSKAVVQMNVYVKTNNASFVGGLVGFNNRAVITADKQTGIVFGSNSAQVVTAINANLSPQETAFNNYSSFGGVVGFNNGVVENIIAKASIFGVYENSTDYYNIKNVGGVVGYNIGLVQGNKSFPLLQGYINVGGVVGKSATAIVTLKVNGNDKEFKNGKMAVGDGLFTMVDSVEYNKYFRIHIEEFETQSLSGVDFLDLMEDYLGNLAKAETVYNNYYGGREGDYYYVIKISDHDIFDTDPKISYSYSYDTRYTGFASEDSYDYLVLEEIAFVLGKYKSNHIENNSVEFLQLDDKVKIYNSAIVGFDNIGGLVGEYVGLSTPLNIIEVGSDKATAGQATLTAIAYNTVHNYSLKPVEQKSGTVGGNGFYGNILLSNAHYFRVDKLNRNYAGGLVGKMSNGSIFSNQVFASIQGELAGLGGLVGKVEGTTNISNCSFVGAIINRDSAATAEVKPATGGLVGDSLKATTLFAHSGYASATDEEAYKYSSSCVWYYSVNPKNQITWVAGDHNNIASCYFKAKDINGNYIKTYEDTTDPEYEYKKSMGYIGDSRVELDYTYYHSDGTKKEFVVDGFTYTTKKVWVDTLSANEKSCPDCNPSFVFDEDEIDETKLTEFIDDNKAYRFVGEDLNGDGLVDAHTGVDYSNKTLEQFKTAYLNQTSWYVNELINDGLPVILSSNKLTPTGENSYKISLLANFPPTDIVLENKENKIDTFIKNLPDDLSSVVYYYGLDSSNYKTGTDTLNFTSTNSADKISTSTAELNAQLLKQNSYSLDEILTLTSIPTFIDGNSFKIKSSNSSVLSVEFDNSGNIKFVAKSAGYALLTITSEYNVSLSKTVAVNVANASDELKLGYFESGQQKYVQDNQVLVINKSTEDKQITLPVSSNLSANQIFNGNSFPEVTESFKLISNRNSGVRYYFAGLTTSGGGTPCPTIYYATNDIEGLINSIQLKINNLKFGYEYIGQITGATPTNYYTVYIDVPYGTTANFVGIEETLNDITLIAVPYLVTTSAKGETNKILLANLGDYDDGVLLTEGELRGVAVPAENTVVLNQNRFDVASYNYTQYTADYISNLESLITMFKVRVTKATWNLTKDKDAIANDVKTESSFNITIETDKDDEELYLAYFHSFGSESVERKISYTNLFANLGGEVNVGNITLQGNNKTITSVGNKNYVNYNFTVLVKDENKNNVQDVVSTTFKFFVVKSDAVLETDANGFINNAISSVVESNMLLSLPVTLTPQTITEIELKHYPNSESKVIIDAMGNKITEINLNEIAYENIIPGNVGVLKAYISPYYASYDELHIISSVSTGSVVLFEQLMARTTETAAGLIYNGSYETLIVSNNKVENGIKLVKVSNINQDREQNYDGNIYIRTMLNSFKSEADKFTLTIRAYKNGVLVKEKPIVLDVQTPPSLNLSVNGADSAPIARGTEVKFDAQLTDIDGNIDFSGSYMYRINSNGIEVKVGSINADFMVKNNSGVYSVSVNNDVASDRYIKVVGTVTKQINGETITHSDYITLHVTDFVIEEISVESVTNGNFVGMFNQPYSLIVRISKATYNPANTDTVKEKIKKLEADFSRYSETDSILQTWKLVKTLQGVGSATRYASLKVGFNGNDSFVIGTRVEEALGNIPVYTLQNTKFGSGDILAAVVQFVYTDQGIIPVLNDADRVTYSSSEYFYEKSFEFGFGFYRIRDEERPDPIETAEQFKQMADGVDYILVSDIVLEDWEPFREDLKINSLDGNGYVITIKSFSLPTYTEGQALLDSANIGIFSKIHAGTTIKNLTIEVPSQQKSNQIELATYDNTAVDLYVDARAYKSVNFGVLAAENSGLITNCQIINDAGALREERELTIARQYFLTDPRYMDYKTYDGGGNLVFNEEQFILDNWDVFRKGQVQRYDAAGKLYGEVTGSDTDRHLSVVRVETTTTVETQIHYMSGLVAQNVLDGETSEVGYITNSSVENITINGVGYVSGFVANNAGKISSSYFKGANIINRVAENYAEAATAGFVVKNSGEKASIQYSYIQGRLGEGDKYANPKTGGGLTNGDKTGLTADNKAGFAGYNYANNGGSASISSLRALNALITTKTNAAGFVYSNESIISNSYSNIIVNSSMGTSGFVFTNAKKGTISSCYSLSSVKTNSWDASPFTGRAATHEYNNENPDGIVDCHYLKLGSDENSSALEVEYAEDYLEGDEPATSLGSSQFGEYNTFQSYAFNTDFELSTADKVTRAVWFIPNDASSDLYEEHFKNTFYVRSRPELVAANLRTISVRVWVGSETSNENSYTYVSTVIGQGIHNPLLVKTAEDFNRYLNYESTIDDNERNFAIRFISDITFNKTDLTAQTYNMDYYGDLDGNGMDINQLRLVSDTDFENVETGQPITDLGLFGRIITKDLGDENYQRGVVRNINIAVSEVAGSKVMNVGALAGSIENADVFNVNISGNVVIQGKNLVGGLAGIIKGDSEIVNITSSLSARAAFFKETNRFSTNFPTELPAVYGTFNLYYSELQGDAVSNSDEVSYAGGIAGVFDVKERSEEEGMNPLSLFNAKARSLQVTGDVTIIGEVVGGIFGLNGQEATTSDLSFIVKEGTQPKLRGSRIVGGLVGENRGEIERSYIAHESTLQEKIDQSYKTGIAGGTYTNSNLNYNDLYSSNAHYTGGLVGFNNDGKITNAYSKLNVINMNSMFAGGFVGLSIGGEYNFCYTVGSVSAFSSAGGFIGAQAQYPFNITKTGSGENEVITYSANTRFARYIYFEPNSENGKSIGSGSTKLVGVVAANLWRPEDLVTNRTTLYSAEDLKIGTMIGVAVMADNGSGKYQLSDIIDIGDLTERKKNETIFFMQPEIVSLRHNAVYNSNDFYKLMPEIGAFEDKLGFIYNQKNLTRDYRFSTSVDSATDGDTYNEAADSSVTQVARPQGLSGYAAEPKKNEDNEYIVNGVAGTGAGYTSATADKNYYRYSRMQNIGSARSLKEIITTLDIIETDAAGMGDHSSDDLDGKKDSYDDIINTPIFNTWNVNRWTGVRKETADDQNTVFPYLEAKPEKTKILVYQKSDLELMSVYVNAEFVLMNDIDLQADGPSSWAPVGTKAIPFKGLLHSNDRPATPGANWPYTIYNLSVTSAGAAYAGLVGYAAEAEFKDFNLSTASVVVDGSEDTPLFVGSLVGYASSGTVFENIKILTDNAKYKTPDGAAYGAKLTTSTAASVGGLVGFSDMGTINNVDLKDVEINITGIGDLSRVESERPKTLGFGGVAGYLTSAEPATPMVAGASVEGTINLKSGATALLLPDDARCGGSTGFSFDVGGVIGRSNDADSSQARVLNLSSKVKITANLNAGGTTNISSINIGGAIGKAQNTLFTENEVVDDETTVVTNIYRNFVEGSGSTDIDVDLTNFAKTADSRTSTFNVGGAVGSVYARDAELTATYVTESLSQISVGKTTAVKMTVDITNSAYLNSNVGGVAGYAENATAKHLYSNVDINVTDGSAGGATYGSTIIAGGLIGKVVNGQNMSNLHSAGMVYVHSSLTGTINNNVYAGGAFGDVYLGEVATVLQTINKGVSQATVSVDMASSDNDGTVIAGGFIGRIFGGKVTQSASVGRVLILNGKQNKTNYAGGFVGFINMQNPQIEIPAIAGGAVASTPNLLAFENNYSSADLQLTSIFESESDSYAGLFIGNIYYGYEAGFKHLTLKNNYTIGKYIYTGNNGANYYDSLYIERNNKGGFLGGYTYYAGSGVNSTNVERASNLVYVNNFYNSDFVPYTNGHLKGLSTEVMLYNANATFAEFKDVKTTSEAGAEVSVWTVANNNYPRLVWIENSSNAINATTGAVDNAKLEDSVAGHSIFSVQTEGSKTRPSTTVDASLTKQTYIATSSSQIGNLNGKTLTNKTVYVKGNQAFSGTITEVDALSAIIGLYVTSGSSTVITTNKGYLANSSVVKNVVGTNNGVIYRLTFAGTNLASTLVTTNNGGIDTMVAEDTSSSQSAVSLIGTNNGVVYRSIIKNTKVTFASTLGKIKSSYYLSTVDSKTVANYFNQMGSDYSYEINGTGVNFDLANMDGNILSGDGFDFANDWIVVEPKSTASAVDKLTLNYGAPILRYELATANSTRGGYNFDEGIRSAMYWTSTGTTFNNLLVKYANQTVIKLNNETQFAEIAQATSVGEVVTGYPVSELETTPAISSVYNNESAITDASTLVSGTTYNYKEVETTEYVYGVKTVNKRKLLNFQASDIYLMKDMDLGGQLWTPIGFGFDNLQVNVGDVITSLNSSSHNVFMGTFNGSGYIISNVTTIESNKNVGLFGTAYVNAGADIPAFANIVIRNSNFISVSKNGGFSLAGALVGRVILGKDNSTQYVLSKVGTEHANVFATNRASGLVGDYLSLSSADSVGTTNLTRFIKAKMNYAYVNSNVIVSKGTGNVAAGFVNYGNNNIYQPSHALVAHTINTGLEQLYFSGEIGDYRLNSDNDYKFVNQHTDLSTGYDGDNAVEVSSLYGMVKNVLASDDTIAKQSVYALDIMDAVVMNTSGNVNDEYMTNESFPNFDWGSVWTRLTGTNDNYPVLISKVGYWVETIKEPGFTQPSYNGSTKTYSVSTPQQLAWIANKVNTDTSSSVMSGQTVQLTADINLSGRVWSSIGYNSGSGYHAFAGKFDFNGKTISGMTVSGAYINKSDYAGDVDIEEEFVDVVCLTSKTVGLFGATEGAEITSSSGVGKINGLAVGSSAHVGSVIGLQKNGKVSNIESSVVVRTTDDKSAVSDVVTGTGGIVGTIQNTTLVTLDNLVNNGIITSSSDGVGGIVGYIDQDSSAAVNITKARNTGNITSTAGFVGGILGYCEGCVNINGVANYVNDNTADSTNKNYKTSTTPDNTGNIKGLAYVGGIAGCVELGTIESVTNSGNVVATGNNAGGIVGLLNEINDSGKIDVGAGSAVYEAVNIGNIYALNNAGGIIGNMQSVNAEIVNLLNRGYVNLYVEGDDTEPTANTLQNGFGSIVGAKTGHEATLLSNAYSIIDVTTANRSTYMIGGLVEYPQSGTHDYLKHAIFNIYATQKVGVTSQISSVAIGEVKLVDIFTQNLVWEGVVEGASKYDIQLKYNNVPGGIAPAIVSNAFQVESQEHMQYLSDLNKKRFGKSSISASQSIKITKAFTINNGNATEMGSSAYTWGNDVDGGNFKITLSVGKDLFGIVRGGSSNYTTIKNLKVTPTTTHETSGVVMKDGDYAEFINVDIESSSTSAGAETFGALAYKLNRSKVTDCDIALKITSTTTNSKVGGLVGTVTNTTFTNSNFTGEIKPGSGVTIEYAGGLAAVSEKNTYSGCSVGTIKMTASSTFDSRIGYIEGKYAGGIVSKSGTNDKFDTCTSSTNIMGAGYTYSGDSTSVSGTVAGGIVAVANGTKEINACGNQSLIKAAKAGGIVGRIDSSISDGIKTPTNYIFGEIIAKDYAGGIVGDGTATKITNAKSEGFVAVFSLDTGNYAGGIAGELDGSGASITNSSMKGYVGIWERWATKSGGYGTNYYLTSKLLDTTHGGGNYTASEGNNDKTNSHGKNGTYGDYHYAAIAASGISSGTGNTANLYAELVLIDYYVNIKQEYSHQWTGTRTVKLSSEWVRASVGTKSCNYGGMKLATEKSGSAGGTDSEKGYVHFPPDYSKCSITATVSVQTTPSIPANSDAKSYILKLTSSTYNTPTNDYPSENRYFEGQNIQLPIGGLDKTGGRELAGWYTQNNGAGTKINDGVSIDSIASYADGSNVITLYAYWDRISISVNLYGKGNQYHDHLQSDVDHDFADMNETEQQAAETAAANAKTASYVGSFTGARYDDKFASLKSQITSSPIKENLSLSGYRVAGWFWISPLKWNELVYNMTELSAINNYHKASKEELKELTGYDSKSDFTNQTITSAMMGGPISGLPAKYRAIQIVDDTKFSGSSNDIFAYWIQTFQVTFYKNNGQTNGTETVDKGSTVSQPTNPTKSGYTFDGWYTDSACTNRFNFSTVITANTPLYAKWVGNEVNITFNYYDDVAGSNVVLKTMKVRNGEQIKPSDIPSVTRDGYAFAGWYKGASLHTSDTTFTYTVDEGASTSLTFTAKYSADSYTVNFYTEAGGTVYKTFTANHNSTITSFTDPTKAGSTFVGWYVSTNGGVTLGAEYKFADLITGNLEIYAKWDTAKVTITFKVQDSGGNWVTHDSVETNYGELVGSFPSEPVKTGDYRFAGWCTSDALTTLVDFTTYKPTANATLYAKFNEQVTVTFLDADGNSIGVAKVDKGASLTKADMVAALSVIPDIEGYFPTETSTTLSFENVATGAGANPLTDIFNDNVSLTVYGY